MPHICGMQTSSIMQIKILAYKKAKDKYITRSDFPTQNISYTEYTLLTVVSA